MNRYSLSLAAAVLLISGGFGAAQNSMNPPQPRVDGQGNGNAPTPRPQAVSPNAAGPNKPIPGNAAEAQPVRPPAGPILADPKQPATTGQGGPLKSPNAPLADD
jgi:hypothetical protein